MLLGRDAVILRPASMRLPKIEIVFKSKYFNGNLCELFSNSHCEKPLPGLSKVHVAIRNLRCLSTGNTSGANFAKARKQKSHPNVTKTDLVRCSSDIVHMSTLPFRVQAVDLINSPVQSKSSEPDQLFRTGPVHLIAVRLWM